MVNSGQRARPCWHVADVLLQQLDVEDVMKSGACRQLEALGGITDPLTDQEWPIVLGSQLVVPFHIEGRLRSVKEAQPDLVTDGEFLPGAYACDHKTSCVPTTLAPGGHGSP
jgi:hypothetical protein